MVFSGEENLAPVNNGMTVGETVNMTMQDNTFPYKVGILKIIPPFYIITNIITDDYFIRIT
jgi:hypothetical protein